MSSLKQKFDDCPYNCVNGWYLDRQLLKKIPCPHCSEKKKEMVNRGEVETEEGDISSLATILGIENPFLKTKLVYESVVPDGELIYIEEESVERQKDVATELYLGLTVGQLPCRSYCFGLGNKGRVDRFVYPILAKAYLSGLSVAKFISCTDYNRMLVAMSDEIDALYSADLVMMLICDGSSKADISSAKGLMQTRALRGKPTIFVTTWSIEACSILLGYWEDETYFLAGGVFLEYKRSSGSKHSHYINQLTGVKNTAFGVEEDDSVNDSESNTDNGKGVSLASLFGN